MSHFNTAVIQTSKFFWPAAAMYLMIFYIQYIFLHILLIMFYKLLSKRHVIPGSPISATVLIRPIPAVHLSIAHHVFPNTFAGYFTLELKCSCARRTVQLVRIIITVGITITPFPCFQAVAICTLIMMWCLARTILLV